MGSWAGSLRYGILCDRHGGSGDAYCPHFTCVASGVRGVSGTFPGREWLAWGSGPGNHVLTPPARSAGPGSGRGGSVQTVAGGSRPQGIAGATYRCLGPASTTCPLRSVTALDGSLSSVSSPRFCGSTALRQPPSAPLLPETYTLQTFQGKPAPLPPCRLVVAILSAASRLFSQDAALPVLLSGERCFFLPHLCLGWTRGCHSLRSLVLGQSLILPALF